VKKECRLKGGAVNAPPIPISPAVLGFKGIPKRCCKIKNGAMLSAVVENIMLIKTVNMPFITVSKPALKPTP
jgi:hypothetical protein